MRGSLLQAILVQRAWDYSTLPALSEYCTFKDRIQNKWKDDAANPNYSYFGPAFSCLIPAN